MSLENQGEPNVERTLGGFRKHAENVYFFSDFAFKLLEWVTLIVVVMAVAVNNDNIILGLTAIAFALTMSIGIAAKFAIYISSSNNPKLTIFQTRVLVVCTIFLSLIFAIYMFFGVLSIVQQIIAKPPT